MLITAHSDTIRMLSLFDGIAEHEKDALLKDGRPRKFAKGQVVYLQGDNVTHFYIINSGTMQLFRTTPDGHEKTLYLLKAGQTFGENEIMDGCTRHRMNAITVEDTVLTEFSAAWLKEVSSKNGTFALNLLSMLSHKVQLAELEAEQQATMSAPQLVACFLQRICILYGFDPKGFELPYSKSLIASRLGMELETFSRTLVKLREQGIKVEGSRVSIHDLERIQHYVCNACSISEDCATHQAIDKLAQV